ncbi:hypothetical protein [Botrimarina sp.]|uniref:type IV pilus modification PilV family protein n=1 Tax=Botrimarina sp. TaxID=2795802 RepID=UPI0032EDF95A
MASDPSKNDPPPRATAGYSLVEVVAAIALMSATLVPALNFVRDAMRVSDECDRRQVLALYAAAQVEQRLALIASAWSAASASGDYAADGHPDIRFETVADDSAASGGVPGLLMGVRSTTYFDDDGDDLLDPSEMRCEYRTKLGRFATYEALAR